MSSERMRNERLQRAIEQSLVVVDRSDEIARTVYGSLTRASEAIRLANAVRRERTLGSEGIVAADSGSGPRRAGPTAAGSEQGDTAEAAEHTRA